jgi:DNA polymerase-3 subunit delta'
LYFPLPRPKNASTPEKLARALEDARAEALVEFRANPLRPAGDEGPKALYLAAARSLRQKAHRRPSMGPRQVFIIAQAEALAPQASSSEAANALLKVLEEPPTGTSLILTSAEPGRLLPTIRSRTTQVHLPPLTQAEVTEFLVTHAGMDETAAQAAAGFSRGAIGRALGFRKDGDEPGPLEQTRMNALALLAAALAPEPERRIKSSLEFQSTGARGLRDLFNFLEECLGELARTASGAPLEGGSPKETEFLQRAVSRWKIHPSSVPGAVEKVDRARTLAAGNVNPQLVIFGLLHELRHVLTGGRTDPTVRS